MDNVYAELQSNIDKYGFTFIGVPGNPLFVYSIGLTARGWPEVLMLGSLNPSVIEIILTDLVQEWIAKGEFKLGDNHDMIQFADGSSHALRVVTIPADLALAEYGCQAQVFFDKEKISFVQVLWPDKEGKYPNDEGFDKTMVQPIVGQ